jgi:hypothetical protein
VQNQTHHASNQVKSISRASQGRGCEWRHQENEERAEVDRVGCMRGGAGVRRRQPEQQGLGLARIRAHRTR